MEIGKSIELISESVLGVVERPGVLQVAAVR